MTLQSVQHPDGRFRYLPAISAYSAGVAAEDGFEIVELRLSERVSLREGFERIDREIERRHLTSTALVGMVLRSPEVFDLDAFSRFNTEHQQHLVDRQLSAGDVNPLSRTNVVPLHTGPPEPAIHAAFIVQPASDGDGGRDFVVAGAGEVDGALLAENIVARGDTSPAGMLAKTQCVLDVMVTRLSALGADVHAPSTINVYSAHDIDGLGTQVAGRLPAVACAGYVRWLARPPVEEIEFEMDCCRVSSGRVI